MAGDMAQAGVLGPGSLLSLRQRSKDYSTQHALEHPSMACAGHGMLGAVVRKRPNLHLWRGCCWHRDWRWGAQGPLLSPPWWGGITTIPSMPQAALGGLTWLRADSSMLQKISNCLKFPVLWVRSSTTGGEGGVSCPRGPGVRAPRSWGGTAPCPCPCPPRAPGPGRGPRVQAALTGGVEAAAPRVGRAPLLHLHVQLAPPRRHAHRVHAPPERHVRLQPPHPRRRHRRACGARVSAHRPRGGGRGRPAPGRGARRGHRWGRGGAGFPMSTRVGGGSQVGGGSREAGHGRGGGAASSQAGGGSPWGHAWGGTKGVAVGGGRGSPWGHAWVGVTGGGGAGGAPRGVTRGRGAPAARAQGKPGAGRGRAWGSHPRSHLRSRRRGPTARPGPARSHWPSPNRRRQPIGFRHAPRPLGPSERADWPAPPERGAVIGCKRRPASRPGIGCQELSVSASPAHGGGRGPYVIHIASYVTHIAPDVTFTPPRSLIQGPPPPLRISQAPPLGTPWPRPARLSFPCLISCPHPRVCARGS